MADIQAEIKRGFLRSLWRAAQAAATPVTLIAALEAFQDQGFASIQSGKSIIAIGSNGTTTQFSVPQIGQQFSEEQVFSLSEELLQAYSEAVTLIGGTPADSAIFAAMMASDRLQAITHYSSDFTGLRLQR